MKAAPSMHQEISPISAASPHTAGVHSHCAWCQSVGAAAQQPGLGPCLGCGGCPGHSVCLLPLPPADTLELAGAPPGQRHHNIRKAVGTKHGPSCICVVAFSLDGAQPEQRRYNISKGMAAKQRPS